MNQEFIEILVGFKRTLILLSLKEKRTLLLAALLMAMAGALTNLPAIVLGRLIDNVVSSTNFTFPTVTPYLALIITAILIREVLTVIRKYLVHKIATQTEKNITVRAIEHLLKTDLAYLNQSQIGALHGRLIRSIQGLVQMIRLSFIDFLPILSSAAAALAITLWQKPFLATVMILVIPTSLLIIIKQISSQKGIRVALLRGKERIDGTVVEMLGGIETIRTLNTTTVEVGKINSITEQLKIKEVEHHLAMALFDSLKYLNEGFFYILVIALSIYLASIELISRGDILVYSILFLSITGPLKEIHRILDHAHESSILVSDLYQLLHQPLDSSFTITQGQTKLSKSGNRLITQIKNLSFSFNRRQVLSRINLQINQGERVGIAGASGCGKTTLIRIMLKLLHNYQGQINLLGQDLPTLTREQIASLISYVPQRGYLFSGTVRDNIGYGVIGDISQPQLVEAAKLANIYQEITRDLGGWEGKVTENGNNLSGGQRQRLVLARLILKSPEIIILDEATSALDNTNEAIIQRNLERKFTGKTLIIVAHRLTTLKNCDRILVLDKGKVVQQGNYHQLSSTPGLFQSYLKQRANE